MEKKSDKKIHNSPKKTNSKNGSKEKSATSNTSSKTVPSKKSSSQLSISHFSSVSTPEYREGWDRIWGSQKSNSKNIKISNKSLELSEEFILLDQDLSDTLKVKILKEFEIYSKKNGTNLPRFTNFKLENIKFSCTLNLINNNKF